MLRGSWNVARRRRAQGVSATARREGMATCLLRWTIRSVRLRYSVSQRRRFKKKCELSAGRKPGMLRSCTLSQLGKERLQLPGALAVNARAIPVHLCGWRGRPEWIAPQSLAGVHAGQHGLDMVRGTSKKCRWNSC